MFHTNNYNLFSSNSAICMKLTAAVCFQNIILVNIFHLSLGVRTIRTSLWGVLASAHIFGQVWQGCWRASYPVGSMRQQIKAS